MWWRRLTQSAMLSVSGVTVGVLARLLFFTRSAIDGSAVGGRGMTIVGVAGVMGDGSSTLGSGWAAGGVCATLGTGVWGKLLASCLTCGLGA